MPVLPRARVRRRAAQRAALNRPDLSQYRGLELDPAPPARPALVDGDPIVEAHPTWFQVHRVEVRHGETRHVLIGEFKRETPAFLFAATQASQVRIRKWGSRDPPYVSARPPRVVTP